MVKYIYSILIALLLLNFRLNAQQQRFIVERAPFCSRLSDEFSPVFFGEGIVFCSNLRDNFIIGYKNDQKRLYKIFYAPLNTTGKKHPKLFSKDLTTYLNDGPVTFNKEENLIYYSRNNTEVNYLGDISDTSNKLGIYRAELVNGNWTNIEPFEYNNPEFSVCMPALAPGGERIYFSSDMPGGYGGLDIYFCKRLNGGWDKPVNLGPVINTPKNESFPFAFYYNKLYFSSDGHPGSGGKDIYYTQEINNEWILPIQLDTTINSPADDFGIVFDSTLEKGYFSSNRDRSDDIYSFRTPPVDFASCDSITEENFCYVFYDERLHPGDTVRGLYVWDFGKGVRRTGPQVMHCFPGPGDYNISLNILDTLTGDTLSEQVFYDIKIEAIEQAYINSYNSGIVDKPVHFDGLEVNLKNFRLTDYFWNFGDGFVPGGPVMDKSFRKKGEYTIQMGLLGENDSSGINQKKCFTKKVRIFDSFEELGSGDIKEDELIALADDNQADYLKISTEIFFMGDLSERQKNRIKSSLRFTGQHTLNFLRNGILPESPVLDNLIKILKDNPEVKLEMVLHSFREKEPDYRMELSERLAQEICVYFENSGIGTDSFNCKGLGTSRSSLKAVVQDNDTINGVIEFIFLEKSRR